MAGDKSQTAEPEAWLIWSGEHHAWWRKGQQGGGNGYAIGLGGAGRWTRSDAEAMTLHCGPEKKIDIVPDPYGPFAEDVEPNHAAIRSASQ